MWQIKKSNYMKRISKCQHCAKEFLADELPENHKCIGYHMTTLKVCGICSEENCQHFLISKSEQEQTFWESHLNVPENVEKWKYIFRY